MERIKDLIKEYLIETIQTKRNMRKRIYQLDEENRELKLSIKDTINQKEIYKQKCKKQNKTIIELRKKIKEMK